MHIFLTNDDGYQAPGIIALAREIARFGRVTVIAPDKGRSSCSSSLTLQQYIRLWKKESYGENITVLACSGTTADCAKLGLEHWLREDRPDLIVSGMNNGFNTGSDCLYSGTVAGALEGTFFDIPALACSVETVKDPALLEKACRLAGEVIETYFVKRNYKGILNLNVPDTEKLSLSDIKICKLGLQRYENVIREEKDPSGRLGFWLSGKPVGEANPDEDVYWAHRGVPTLTPIRWDQTDTARIEAVKEIAEAK